MERISLQKLKKAATQVLELSKSYSKQYGELWFDGLLLGYLDGKFGGMQRQRHSLAGRIDFRQGGTRPVVIELAVRTEKQPAAIYGSQNSAELGKLARESKASVRCLLLMDTCNSI